MENIDVRELNQRAYPNLRQTINDTYPVGRLVAIFGGQVIADAPNFDELENTLSQLGKHSPDVLVVEAGVEQPEQLIIL